MFRPVFIINFEIKPTGLLFFSQLHTYILNPEIMPKPMCFRRGKYVHLYCWRQLTQGKYWDQDGGKPRLSTHPKESVQERPWCNSPGEEAGQEPKNPTVVS